MAFTAPGKPLPTRAATSTASTSRSEFSEQSQRRGRIGSKKEYDYLTEDQLQKLEAEAKGNRWGLRDWLAIRLAWRHGLRASELVGLEWHDFALAEGTARVRRAKNGREATHWLDGEETRALRKLQRTQAAGSRWVFQSERGGQWAAVSFSRMVERAGDRALPGRGVHAHMLRHTCGHLLAAKGVDTRRIQDQLGHKSISSTQIYTQLQSRHLKGIWN
ncbi:tyrosine-type recombinase/integrase [Synechococcus sp. CBW1107]|uniref:tyrosine-type recombinase/integrase n=1 Tax=Synechococcus sp. CBW1107 TaxID=2789857 RepID=UPI002AD37B89|nr:tyrosine-type recombinase/integrase [Synechococcus sp. CBW1107]CAK6701010.1 Tyrosine recombinase XerD [Synechococcus sp. CBW1107]